MAYAIEAVFEGSVCKAGGAGGEHENYNQPHYVLPDTSNCAACGVEMVMYARLPEGIFLNTQ